MDSSLNIFFFLGGGGGKILRVVFQVGCPEEIIEMHGSWALFVQITTSERNPLEMNIAGVTCTNKDNSHFSSRRPTCKKNAWELALFVQITTAE